MGQTGLAKEPQKFLLAMASLAVSDHLSGGHIQRCELGCGAVSDVVVGDTLDVAMADGKQPLSSVQNLHLRLYHRRRAPSLCWVG